MTSSKLLAVLFIFLLGLGLIWFLVKDKSEISTPKLQTAKNQLFLSSKNSNLEPLDFLFLQKNTLKASLPPISYSPQVLGTLAGGYEIEDVRNVIVEYEVEIGDTLWLIAQKFGISLESLLWANDLAESSIIKPGQKLIVPPVSGVIYHVKAGDTISEIAKTYKGNVDEIIAFNQLPETGEIFVGDILIIPGGKMPTVSPKSTAPTYAPLAKSYFICPINPPCRITQGLHWYNAVDFSHGKCGEPVYAAAAGKVLKVRLTNSTSRWAFGGAGNHITILHPNGVVTMYGHILRSLVSPGQYVSQGQMIATMGGKPGTPGAGLSTGCHLHFGVMGAKNPFAK